MMFGTDEQKSRFLPGIHEAEEFWCQGFSEPDAGSDLANVKTTAVRDGEEWVINGQKLWTSLGHISDWIFVVCRTDAKAARKHDGISFLLCPVDQPGVEMRPIRQMTGTAEFNEVFFTDARTDVRPGRRGGRPRLEGGAGHARVRAGHRVPRPAAPVGTGVPVGPGGRAPTRPEHRSGRSASGWPMPTSG